MKTPQTIFKDFCNGDSNPLNRDKINKRFEDFPANRL